MARHDGAVRALLLLPLLALAACGGSVPAASLPAPAPSTAAEPAPAPGATPAAPPPAAPGKSSKPAPLTPATCPPGAGNCTAHTGTVIAIESVDPDGDGDLHVIASGGGVTAPGITVFDVSKILRPARDPRPGDRVTGAGPVYPGSFRQRQIQVVRFRVERTTSGAGPR